MWYIPPKMTYLNFVGQETIHDRDIGRGDTRPGKARHAVGVCPKSDPISPTGMMNAQTRDRDHQLGNRFRPKEIKRVTRN